LNSPNRILVYCHDLFGLGNIKRMIGYCQHLTYAYQDAKILFVMGSRNINFFPLPDNLEYIKLPEIYRNTCGNIHGRVLELDDSIIEIRASILETVSKNFCPDLLIIDKKPLGAMDELKRLLDQLPASCPRILVCRDILDSPQKTIADMSSSHFNDSVRRHITQIQIMGDQGIFDFGHAYEVPIDIRKKLRYTGYLIPSDMSVSNTKEGVLSEYGFNVEGRTVLVTVGGGEDGEPVVNTALEMAESSQSDIQMIILLGPNMPLASKQLFYQRASGLDNVVIVDESRDISTLLNAVDCVIAMTGYNASCEILAAQKPCVFIPRTEPSEEQLIRANLLASNGFGVTHMIHAKADSLRASVDLAIKTYRILAPIHSITSSHRISQAIEEAQQSVMSMRGAIA